MKRRTFLASALAATAIGAPGLAAPSADRVLKFIPQADLAVLDPIWTTGYVTRNHAYRGDLAGVMPRFAVFWNVKGA